MSRSSPNRKKKRLTRRQQRAALAASELAAPVEEPPAAAAVDPSLADPAAARQRRKDLWALGIRLAIPLVGVLALGWPQMTAALFYIFEAWLFVVARVTTEAVVSAEFRRSTGYSTFRIVLSSVFGVAILLALLGGLSLVLLIEEFLANEWEDFAAGGWRDPVLLASFAFVVVQQIFDVVRFVKAYPGRDGELKRRHDLEKASRLIALFACNFAVGLGQSIGFPGFAQILAMSALMFTIESSTSWLRPSKAAKKGSRRQWQEFESRV